MAVLSSLGHDRKFLSAGKIKSLRGYHQDDNMNIVAKAQSVVLRLLLVLLMFCGCVAYKQMGRDTPNLHVAYGHRLPDSALPFQCSNIVAYEIREIVYGHFLTNDIVYVQYFSSSLPQAGLPENAILILNYASYVFDGYEEALAFESEDGRITDSFSLRKYEALGGDAYRGLLPDTAENRRFIASQTLSRLVSNPPAKQLARQDALLKAKAILALDKESAGYRWKLDAQRYSYGWNVSANEGHVIGAHCMIIVGDDGVVKEIMPGR